MANIRHVSFNLSSDDLAELQELTRSRSRSVAAEIRQQIDRDRWLADLADFELLGWSDTQNTISVRDGDGREMTLLAGEDLRELVEPSGSLGR